MSKFVVTGAHGYVAKRLIRRLVADDHEVVGLTRVCSSNAEGLKRGYREVAVGDYTDEKLLACIVNSAQAVFHLAARAHQPSAGKYETALFHAANVVPTEALARACAVTGVGRFIMLSSIGVLGNRTDKAAFTDASFPAAVDPYALSKLHAEQRLIEILSNYNYNCDYCIFRPPLVYGPESPGNFATLVAIAAKAPLVPLAAIRAPRSFIHVDHLVDALVVAATHPAAARRTFVIADGMDTSVSEIVFIAARIFGRDPRRVVAIPEFLLRPLSILAGQRKRFEKLVAPLRVDCSGFQDATGWRPAQPTPEAIASSLRNWPRINN